MDQLTQSDIEALVKQYPLPDGVDDCVMTREELADALVVSTNTVTAWLGDGMPVQQVGSQGRPYELRLSHCWAWRQAKRREEDLRSETVKRAQAALRLAIVGGDPDSVEALDPKTRREIIAAQREQEAFQRDRNELMRRDDVRKMLDELFAMVRDVMESAPDQVERVTAIPPKAADDLVKVCDGLVEEFARRVDAFWQARPEGVSRLNSEKLDA
ncbi:terminase small subunit [Pseudaminobacter soli (ex Li et al. 2025)]|uniref:Terminase small subunit n=1 Tax=Pseudaminobacter soli (ex Li et al. 2025) TaxID=1295366 RepID=A0A2P7RZX8_9HYPH|nr:terminase small subunit [Mesorhizobium soli]PSJ55771.1 hypothetical protein C7I85_26130 [Mesorhizobium soli]